MTHKSSKKGINSACPHAERCQKFTLFLCFLVLWVAVLTPFESARAGRRVELSFDDDVDGAGAHNGYAELNNMQNNNASLGVGQCTARLAGEARRSTVSEGRYGRAADIPAGNGSIEIECPDYGISGTGIVTLFAWLKARDASGGHILASDDSHYVKLVSGEFVIEAPGNGGGTVSLPTGVSWPTDGAYHHLTISLDTGGAIPLVRLILDFEAVAEVDVTGIVPPDGFGVKVGEGFDGLIDTVLITNNAPGEGDLFDFSPTYCPSGLTCFEEVLTTIPRDFTHPVPTRFKVAYDAGTCSPATPCPLLFSISGGGSCADDYDSGVSTWTQHGFMVVTVDPYCEAGGLDAPLFPTETSQFVSVKDYLMTGSPVHALIDGPTYSATGCSHGAGTVTLWMMHETDYPVRTFARSPGTDPLCAYAADVYCPNVAAFLEQRVIDLIGSLDFEDPLVRALHERNAGADLLTAEITATREFALSWGVNLVGEVCDGNGDYLCNEEGMWGMTYADRRLRDGWLLLEPQGAPTGYFVEDRSEDCRHCASPSGKAFACGACLLVHGRQDMETACPECLTYQGNDIDPGAPAQVCPMEASWYTDPLAPYLDCTDLDGDGYGDPASLSCPHPERDCNDGTPDVNPGMPEIPGNGIDDDCDADSPPWGTPASSMDANTLPGTDALNLLCFLLVPLGVILFIRTKRKKGGRLFS
jgi:hypothetical protein